eukprot:1142645-Lingulodinium_polyedra.AAC.1
MMVSTMYSLAQQSVENQGGLAGPSGPVGSLTSDKAFSSASEGRLGAACIAALCSSKATLVRNFAFLSKISFMAAKSSE